MVYDPKPIKTSAIELSKDIVELTERLAENTHEVWARERMGQGWRYGEKRDDEHKLHPCLIPYEDLPESEKDYDRQTALETIKVILALGYRIESPEELADLGHRPEKQARDADLFNRILAEPRSVNLDEALELWRARQAESWSRRPELYRALAEQTLRLGEPLLAYDVTDEGANLWPRDVRLRQLKALALFRCRATARALEVLVALKKEGQRDEDTLAMMGRAHKDLADAAEIRRDREHHWEQSFHSYHEAYENTGGYYSAINAATMAKVVGKEKEALELAEQVRKQCLEELGQLAEKGGDQYWLTATLAEAALILEDFEEAEKLYLRAAEMARDRFGDLSSTRRNARLLMREMHLDPDWIRRLESCFQVPRVVVFTGHMVDQPGREKPRFPAELEESVKEAIKERLRRVDGRVGFASAACGSDILFLESLLDLGGEAHVVLPYDRDRFLQDSVDIVPGGNWSQRFRDVLKRAAEVLEASQHPMEGEGVALDYANLLLFGLARIREKQLETDLVPLAVWDGRPGDGPGGTASLIERWKSSGLQVEPIEMDRILKDNSTAPAQTPPPQQVSQPVREPVAPGFEMELKSLIFADAVGFSKLNEKQVPLFVAHFLGGINDLMIAGGHAPLIKETWGDGLYFAFNTAGDAGRFALEICDMVREVKWEERGLPKDMTLRIALHGGPVYKYINPLTQKLNYSGVHVTRAARIEPITPPGQVYASREFAALAAAEHVTEFSCEYVGLTPLAKKYGTIPTYHVRRQVKVSG